MKMNPEIKALWLAALRSGEYKQGRGALSSDGEYCCLGVLCDIMVKQLDLELEVKEDVECCTQCKNKVSYDGATSFLPRKVAEAAGIDPQGKLPTVHYTNGEGFDTLFALNDEGASFNYIANVIEDQF